MVRARGFTLVELLVAVALTTVGLLGLLALQGIAIRGNMMSRNFGEAIGIAQQQLEVAERTPYASLASFTTDPACSTSSPCSAGTSGVSPTPDTTSTQAIYTRCTTVTDNGDTTTTVLTRVCWQDTALGWHHVELQTRRSP